MENTISDRKERGMLHFWKMIIFTAVNLLVLFKLMQVLTVIISIFIIYS